MIRRLFALCLPLVLLLGACAHAPAGQCLSPMPGVRYCLLPPAALPNDPAPKLVHVTLPDSEWHMVSRLAVNETELVLIADSLLGQPLFRVRYSADASGGFTFHHSPAETPVQPEWLVAVLQLAYAEIDALNQALRGADLIARNDTRRLQRGTRLLLEMKTTDGKMEITLPQQGVTLRISSLSSEPTP